MYSRSLVFILAMGVAAAQPPTRRHFQNRELERPATATIQYASTGGSANAPSGLREWFDKIRPANSLLIHDGASLPGLDFEQRVQLAGAPAKSWRAALEGPSLKQYFLPLLEKWSGQKAPLHLLAVVNRMDLAEWDSTTSLWTKAETRIVYGAAFDRAIGSNGQREPAKLTVIIEYVHQPLTWSGFQDLARDWAALSNQEKPNKASVAALIAQLAPTGKYPASSARVRTNSNLDRDWLLAQFEPVKGRWTPALLTDQIDPVCFAINVGRCEEFYKLWDALIQKPAVKRVTIPERLLVFRFLNTQYSLLQLQERKEARPRRILSLQECSGCHAKETDTTFQHIKNRPVGGGMAELSGFLKGNEKATFKQLFDDSAAAGWKAEPVKGEAPRYFHDLGRRRLFLAAVLRSGAVANKDDIEWIASFTTDFAH